MNYIHFGTRDRSGHRMIVFRVSKTRLLFSELHVHVRYVIDGPSVCLSSVTFVRPTQAIEIFGNILRHVVPWPSVTFV